MTVFVGSDTRLVVQGITGREGTFHTLRNRAYGTQVVAGVTPGRTAARMTASGRMTAPGRMTARTIARMAAARMTSAPRTPISTRTGVRGMAPQASASI